MEIDIVVPVWNRPIETRSCLVSLIEYSPGARFIFIDNGCDREAERLLQEFAESLDERALLVCTGTNRGLVKAINIGLERAEARFAAVVSHRCLVTEGWLEPLMNLTGENAEAGLVVPRISTVGNAPQRQSRELTAVSREAVSGSLAAMLIRKEVHDSIGGLDEELDGGYWCIRDYSRRAYRAGFLTYAVDGGLIHCKEETPLGSIARREETARRSAGIFHERWGKEHFYCIFFPKGADPVSLEQRRDVLLKGARQGHHFTVIVPYGMYTDLVRKGCDDLHENIRIVALPRFFADGAIGKMYASLRRSRSEIIPVAGIDDIHFPGVADAMPFSALDRLIMKAESEIYHHL